MATWSACMFSFELDVLEIRLATLDPVVDHHLLVECPVTHTGQEKPLVFRDNRDRFARWAHKIEDYVDACPPEGSWTPPATPFAECDSDHWRREHHQREALSRALSACHANDLILVSDCDEIPDPQRCWIEACDLASAGLIAAPRLAMHAGSLAWRWPQAVPGTRTRFLTGTTFFELGRSLDRAVAAPWVDFGPRTAAGAGWHLAYMGGVAEIKRKLASFAHQELNRSPYNTDEHIRTCLATGVDLFGRPERQSVRCPPQEWPRYVREHEQRFSHLTSIEMERQIA